MPALSERTSRASLGRQDSDQDGEPSTDSKMHCEYLYGYILALLPTLHSVSSCLYTCCGKRF
jgi:hypothetical protein